MDRSSTLQKAEARSIVDRVLGERWREIGYDHSDVVSEDDVYGEPAITVTAWLKVGSPILPVGLHGGALLTLRDATRSAGEPRYTYIRLRRPDDGDNIPDQP